MDSQSLVAEVVLAAQQREQEQFAKSLEERRKNPLDEAIRPGGYFHNGAGIPIDCNGEKIPEAEWKPEDLARIKGLAPEVPKVPVDPPKGAVEPVLGAPADSTAIASSAAPAPSTTEGKPKK